MKVNFQDWHRGKSGSFPKKAGIYCVFSKEKGKLIYIGQASDIRDRIQNHERWSDFFKHKDRNGLTLFTTYALLPINYLDKVEGRLIAKNRPPENKTIPTDYYKGLLELNGYVWGLKT